MTRRAILWIVVAGLSVAAAAFSWQYFTSAFPLLSIDIRMDRQAALQRARALAAERRLGPTAYRDAASFSLDESVQSFVELEGGGKPAFSALVADRLYAPYRWTVRHFTEGEKHEATFTFAPDGTPNGFTERLRNDAPGAALAPSAAREIAESTARGLWSVDLTRVSAIEQSQERQPGGRLDHTFVYERLGEQLGEGRYRLRLVVGGDRLTELSYFVKVPDAFSRRYEGMRSVNTAIGIGGSLGFLLLYGAGGIAFGLFVLARQRWVLWRQPVVWGVIVAVAQTAARVNEWPLAWMQYDTALSTQSFILQQVAVALAELALNVTLFSLSFMAAESLTRRAFPGHPQFWKLWDGESGRSPEVLGRTVGGYLLMPVFIAYEVVLYIFATKSLGWWTPSEALFNPDVLAAYSPWLSAIAKSFQAGFWEESLFRAVPIAGAALIGDRLGNRRLWIAVAFVVQAIIFGAGHAPYPTQPAYARPVELIVPSIGFGLLYLQFGLLPGIILHFAFDTFWFAMPIFAASAPGIRVQQIAIVVMVFAPLWIVLVRRAMARGGATRAVVARNASWLPEPSVAATAVSRVAPVQRGIKPSHVLWISVAGAMAAAGWLLVVSRLPVQRHPLQVARAAVLRAAETAVQSAHLGPGWRFLSVAEPIVAQSHRFVWTTAGPSTYASLLGTYLNLPGWTVFVRTFEGDVAERAESWTVDLDANGVVERVTHDLPESRPGASLDEATARQRARRAIAERLALDPAPLTEVSVVPSKLPKRTDWLFTFADRSRTLPRGELRLSTRIAGEEVADVRRFVFVPEDWERSERNAQIIATVVQGAGLLLTIAIGLAGAITAIVSWSRHRFSVRVGLAVTGTFICLAAIPLINGFPALLAALSTSQPFRLQIAVLLVSSAVGLAVQSTATGLVAGAIPMWSPTHRLKPRLALTLGLAVGVIAAAVFAASALPRSGPIWSPTANAASFVPFLSAAVSPVTSLLARMTFSLLVVAAADHISSGWTRRQGRVGALLILVGGVFGNAASPLNLTTWLAFAAVGGVFLLAAYLVVLRHDVRTVPIAVAVIASAATVRDGWARAYPGALTGDLVAVIVMWIAAYAAFRIMSVISEVRMADADTTRVS